MATECGRRGVSSGLLAAPSSRRGGGRRQKRKGARGENGRFGYQRDDHVVRRSGRESRHVVCLRVRVGSASEEPGSARREERRKQAEESPGRRSRARRGTRRPRGPRAWACAAFAHPQFLKRVSCRCTHQSVGAKFAALLGASELAGTWLVLNSHRAPSSVHVLQCLVLSALGGQEALPQTANRLASAVDMILGRRPAWMRWLVAVQRIARWRERERETWRKGEVLATSP